MRTSSLIFILSELLIFSAAVAMISGHAGIGLKIFSYFLATTVVGVIFYIRETDD